MLHCLVARVDWTKVPWRSPRLVKAASGVTVQTPLVARFSADSPGDLLELDGRSGVRA
jgi:hypothetical protein